MFAQVKSAATEAASSAMQPRANYPKAFLVLMALAILSGALHGLGLSGGFFFDDGPNIVHEERIQITRLDFDALKNVAFGGGAGPSGRPVAQLSFALNHYASGLDAFAFKLTNLFIHLFTGLVVWLLARRLLSPLKSPAADWLPIVVAGFFLLHPIQLLPVLHVVQRMTSLAGLFLFAALLLHIRGRESAGYPALVRIALAWGIFWPLSFFSKESGALFPLFVVAWELTVRRSATGHLDRFAKILTAAVVLAVVAGTAYFFSSSGQWLWAGYALRDFSPLERLLTEARVVWVYLGLIFLPSLPAFGLQHDDIVLSTGLLLPWTTLPALLGLAALLWLAWWSRKRSPLFAFGIAWFFIGHLLESTLLPLEIAHEHRNYVPLFGLLIAGAGLVGPLVVEPGSRKTLVWISVVAALGYCALLTGLRAHQFGDEIRRTQIEAMHHPQSSRAHFGAGRALAAIAVRTPADDPSRFFTAYHYEQAAGLNRSAKMPLLGLIHLNCSASLAVKPEWLAELKRRLGETPFAPGDRNVLYAVKEMSVAGTLCLDRTEVTELFIAAKANKTVSPRVRMFLHSWLADYLALAAGDLPAAVAELDKALAIAPHNASNLLKRTQLDILQQHMDGARVLLTRIDATRLTQSEKATFKLLDECLAEHESGGKCAIAAAFPRDP